MRKIVILDTTLRDGEQSPGVNYNVHEKLLIAGQLASLGVDVIEAGFPASSAGDFESVKAIAQAVKSCQIAALSRCIPKEIEHTYEAIKYAKDARLHIFIATSDLHIEHKLRMTREQVSQRIYECVRLAKRICPVVQFSCEDASRTDSAFLVECCKIAAREGADVICLPDTVGYASPQEHAGMFRAVIEAVADPRVVYSAHCHNDLGMAVANSLSAIEAGAGQVDCVIGGIGERAGNAALEEIVMALRTKKQLFGAYTDINTRQIMRTAAIVAHYSGFNISPNKPVVGENVFRHESGIHQHGVLANPLTYEIMNPLDVGVQKGAANLFLGKHSGMHAFEQRVESLGYSLNEDEMKRAFSRFKKLADKKKTLSDSDIIAIANENTSAIPEIYELEYFQIAADSSATATATVKLRCGERLLLETACAGGSIDATFLAIERAVGRKIELDGYYLRAITAGQDALGEVTVRLSIDGHSSIGRGISGDIVEASARGYVAAVNKHIYSRGLDELRASIT